MCGKYMTVVVIVRCCIHVMRSLGPSTVQYIIFVKFVLVLSTATAAIIKSLMVGLLRL